MKYGYEELRRERDEYSELILRGHAEMVPENEKKRAEEQARQWQKVADVLCAPHSGIPGDDCPF